jgi:hypothetical protein
MTTVLRLFIKPAGQAYVDTILAPGQPLQGVLDAWKREGFMWSQNAIVPVESVLYAITIDIPEVPKGEVVPFSPLQFPWGVVKSDPPKEPA